ncbi:MAG: hypothetical protein ACI9YM_001558 [Brevundimonas sp.]|jgi:hypothetical protein|uniref:hypothetical protein n=1 Tax=Brevundimonas sp. TaxID=1871086 RepID=UPI00248A4C81|nr:hypothetical protein [Brevundimonas sp.]MDI1281978.1 hypothetical protein [Brevundimonas sp.]
MPLNNRTILAIGVGVAAVLAIVLALVFSAGGERTPGPSPAERGGLTVDVADAPGLEPTRELRCFVDGRFIGMATLTDCARRNGLATDALDVGLDETGALAAAPTAAFAPPPSLPPVVMAEAEPLPAPATPSQPAPAPVATGNACLRHTGSDWRSLSPNMGLNACVMALYSGTCVRPGEALYGRWGDTTLRLVPRRVEQSSDNSRFRTLAEQDRNCQFPGLDR